MTRRLLFLLVFLAACAGREPPPAAPSAAEPASEAEPQVHPAPSFAPPPSPAPPGTTVAPEIPDDTMDKGTVHSGGLPRTIEEALAVIEAERQQLDVSLGEMSRGSCERACRALDSMRRAVEGLCDLAGDDDPRCERGRSRLTDSEQRVSGAGCGC